MTGEVIHEESSLHGEDGNGRDEERLEGELRMAAQCGTGTSRWSVVAQGLTEPPTPRSDSISIPLADRTFPACRRCNDGVEVSPVFKVGGEW